MKDTGVVPYNGSVRNEGWDYLHQDMYTSMYTAKLRINDGRLGETNGLQRMIRIRYLVSQEVC